MATGIVLAKRLRAAAAADADNGGVAVVGAAVADADDMMGCSQKTRDVEEQETVERVKPEQGEKCRRR